MGRVASYRQVRKASKQAVYRPYTRFYTRFSAS
nr:MAG TPA: hypothetical protein [Caudoviricetes sp.]